MCVHVHVQGGTCRFSMPLNGWKGKSQKSGNGWKELPVMSSNAIMLKASLDRRLTEHKVER